MGSVGANNSINAIHNFQQVSWEGITPQEKAQLSKYIDNNPDVNSQISRGMVVSQTTIDKWLKDGNITLNEMSSWTMGGSGTSQEFANVPRPMDAEEGMRSVILVADNGLPNSAMLPRTNSYDENEVLTKTRSFEIVDSITTDNPYRNASGYRSYSPTITIIKVKGR